MQLNIQLDPSKSNIFLDLLAILKKDNMINDFEIISHDKSKKEFIQTIEASKKDIKEGNISTFDFNDFEKQLG